MHSINTIPLYAAHVTMESLSVWVSHASLLPVLLMSLHVTTPALNVYQTSGFVTRYLTVRAERMKTAVVSDFFLYVQI